MKNIVFFNITKDPDKADKWRLSGRVGGESVSEIHDTQRECTDRAIQILKAYKYTEDKK